MESVTKVQEKETRADLFRNASSFRDGRQSVPRKRLNLKSQKETSISTNFSSFFPMDISSSAVPSWQVGAITGSRSRLQVGATSANWAVTSFGRPSERRTIKFVEASRKSVLRTPPRGTRRLDIGTLHSGLLVQNSSPTNGTP